MSANLPGTESVSVRQICTGPSLWVSGKSVRDRVCKANVSAIRIHCSNEIAFPSVRLTSVMRVSWLILPQGPGSATGWAKDLGLPVCRPRTWVCRGKKDCETTCNGFSQELLYGRRVWISSEFVPICGCVSTMDKVRGTVAMRCLTDKN